MGEFLMPSLGADMEAGTLVEWLKRPGDRVKRGDIVAVVETLWHGPSRRRRRPLDVGMEDRAFRPAPDQPIERNPPLCGRAAGSR